MNGMRHPPPLPDRVAAVSTLDDPVRRALYELIAGSDTALSRDQAAHALGLTRRAAAFHLDRLATQGLLEVEFRRLTGRTGPGAGRPAKLYRQSANEITLTIPERHYDLAAELLAAAVEESTRNGEPVRDVLLRLAADTGRNLGTGAQTFTTALADHGYQPHTDPHGGITLTNCPFHRLAQRHTDTICHLNLELLRGIAHATADHQHTIVLDPAPGRCCVRATPTTP